MAAAGQRLYPSLPRVSTMLSASSGEEEEDDDYVQNEDEVCVNFLCKLERNNYFCISNSCRETLEIIMLKKTTRKGQRTREMKKEKPRLQHTEEEYAILPYR